MDYKYLICKQSELNVEFRGFFLEQRNSIDDRLIRSMQGDNLDELARKSVEAGFNYAGYSITTIQAPKIFVSIKINQSLLTEPVEGKDLKYFLNKHEIYFREWLTRTDEEIRSLGWMKK